MCWIRHLKWRVTKKVIVLLHYPLRPISIVYAFSNDTLNPNLYIQKLTLFSCTSLKIRRVIEGVYGVINRKCPQANPNIKLTRSRSFFIFCHKLFSSRHLRVPSQGGITTLTRVTAPSRPIISPQWLAW